MSPRIERGRFPFPDRPRLWGTAVSHYQVEGNDLCDWTGWEAGGRTRGDACGAAVDSWNRYEADADLALSAGANAFRFSISWSRIEPRPGWYDDGALLRYRKLTGHLQSIGLEPVVTLFHYTHPPWFHESTPWTSPASVERFSAFTRKVVEALGSTVRLYVPLNEPLVFLLAGYYDGQIPPGISSGRMMARALDHLLAAHLAASAVIRELQPEAAIGVAHNMMAFEPRRRFSFTDRLLSTIARRTYNLSLIEAFATGRWSFLLPPGTIVRGRRDDLTSSLDLFGVNYYSRLHLRSPGRDRLIGDFTYVDRSGRGLTDNGWEIAPDPLESLLVEAAGSGLPLVVMENGLADAADSRRASWMEEHLRAIQRAQQRGISIAGYFHWSLLDNYEWLDGFGPRFGLYGVDRTTMERTPRESITTFRRLGGEFLLQE